MIKLIKILAFIITQNLGILVKSQFKFCLIESEVKSICAANILAKYKVLFAKKSAANLLVKNRDLMIISSMKDEVITLEKNIWEYLDEAEKKYGIKTPAYCLTIKANKNEVSLPACY